MSKYGGNQGPPQIGGMTSLKVDNLTYRTTGDDLEKFFRKYGEIGDIYIPKDRNTHESRGFAFVRYYEKRDAEDAMDGMDGKVIDGREIRVAEAKYGRPSQQYNPRGGSGGGSGYRRGRSGSPRRRSRSRTPPRQQRRRSRSRSRTPRRSRSPARRSPSRSRSRSR